MNTDITKLVTMMVGDVPRFPGLRAECAKRIPGRHKSGPHVQCPKCFGLGYTVNDSLEALLEAVGAGGFEWQASTSFGWSVFPPFHRGDDDYKIFFGAPQEALAAALLAAVGKKEA